jgi:hypothetical protein
MRGKEIAGKLVDWADAYRGLHAGTMAGGARLREPRKRKPGIIMLSLDAQARQAARADARLRLAGVRA